MYDLLYEIEGLLPEKVEVDLKKALLISEDIDHEVDTAASKYGYYAVLGEKAETRYQKTKMNHKIWTSEAESKANKERADEGAKPFTVAQMEAYVAPQGKNRLYEKKLRELDEHRRILKVIARAFEIRCGLIQTKSSNRRKEAR